MIEGDFLGYLNNLIKRNYLLIDNDYEFKKIKIAIEASKKEDEIEKFIPYVLNQFFSNKNSNFPLFLKIFELFYIIGLESHGKLIIQILYIYRKHLNEMPKKSLISSQILKFAKLIATLLKHTGVDYNTEISTLHNFFQKFDPHFVFSFISYLSNISNKENEKHLNFVFSDRRFLKEMLNSTFYKNILIKMFNETGKKLFFQFIENIEYNVLKTLIDYEMMKNGRSSLVELKNEHGESILEIVSRKELRNNKFYNYLVKIYSKLNIKIENKVE